MGPLGVISGGGGLGEGMGVVDREDRLYRFCGGGGGESVRGVLRFVGGGENREDVDFRCGGGENGGVCLCGGGGDNVRGPERLCGGGGESVRGVERFPSAGGDDVMA